MENSTPQNEIDEDSVEKQNLARLEKRRVLKLVKWLLYLVYVLLGYIILKELAPVLTNGFAAAWILPWWLRCCIVRWATD